MDTELIINTPNTVIQDIDGYWYSFADEGQFSFAVCNTTDYTVMEMRDNIATLDALFPSSSVLKFYRLIESRDNYKMKPLRE